ncbi:hypothetical protein QTG54_012081 [Skeletonema marinoi]|uniref:Uncharacterized protein n=1 Tax=Skeletonema marinoi TaxID=267567 RepID=A0AAD8Y0A6_9STRA|nr:hypothetical protein QTG54_012081 [Skeletonema marinoi]
MQSSNGRELSMFEFDETDDDILSTFDHFDGSDLNGDDLLEALSNHDDNLFDDIDVDNDADMSVPPQAPQPNTQSCSAGTNNNINININNSFHGFKGKPAMTSVATVDPFRRRASLDGDTNRPLINRRRLNKKKSGRNNNIPSEEPLFGGGIRRQSDGDIMFDDDDNYPESDAASVSSARSAPADLMALCGLYDDPTNTPDVLDIHSMFLNPNKKQQPKQQKSNGMKEMEMLFGGGPDEETMLVRQRQQQLLQEERRLLEAAASQRPRRRKSYDEKIPMMDELRMNMIQAGGSVNPAYGDTVMSGTNVQIKRRKSEPSMLDFFGEEMNVNGRNVNDNAFGNSCGSNMNQSAHSLDHLIGFPTSSYPSESTPPNTAVSDNCGKSALDVAVEEAQDKINHLKQLLLVSRGLKSSGTSGGLGSEQVPQEKSVKKSWWSSLESELGGSSLNPNQSSFGPDQDLTIPSKRDPKKKPKKQPKKKPKPAAPAQIPLPDKPDPEILNLDPTKLMEKLKASMSKTSSSMKQLQEWDRANGLPKSHSQTMVNSNKSRKQLAQGAGMAPVGETKKEDEDEIEQENLNAVHCLNAMTQENDV